MCGSRLLLKQRFTRQRRVGRNTSTICGLDESSWNHTQNCTKTSLIMYLPNIPTKFFMFTVSTINVPLNEAQKKEYMCSKKPLH